MKENKISVEQLKNDAAHYARLEKEGANGWEWYCTCAIGNLLLNEEITLAYIIQMTKEELDVTISLSSEIVKKFQSKRLALAFIEKYESIYGSEIDKENFAEEEIIPLKKFLSEEI